MWRKLLRRGASNLHTETAKDLSRQSRGPAKLFFFRSSNALLKKHRWCSSLRISFNESLKPVTINQSNPRRTVSQRRCIRNAKNRSACSLWVMILLVLCITTTVAEDWPQWRGLRRDGTWNESGIVERFPTSGLKISWRLPVGPGFSSPIIAAGRVYLTDAELIRPKPNERIYCLDAADGKLLWKHSYQVEYEEWAFDPKTPGGPRATPILRDSKLYTLGVTGELLCLDALRGNVLWHKALKKEYQATNSTFTASPLIERDLLFIIVGADPGPCVAAFDRTSGKEIWRALDDPSVYSSPIIVSAAGKKQLIVVTLHSVSSLDPYTGKVYWRERVRSTRDVSVPTPVYSNGFLWVNGMMLKLRMDQPGTVVLWPQDQAPASKMLSNTATAQFLGDHLFVGNFSGQLICVQPETGKILWETDKATPSRNGASIHLTPNGNSVFLFNDQGELIRARLSPEGYGEISRAPLLNGTYFYGAKEYTWAPPSFSGGRVYARNDKELVCAELKMVP